MQRRVCVEDGLHDEGFRFNSLLEMLRDEVDVLLYLEQSNSFNSLLEMRALDACIVQRRQCNSFNSLLEMLSSTSCAGEPPTTSFQFSIGDAYGAMMVVTYMDPNVSILYWRCSRNTSLPPSRWGWFQFSIGDA